MTLQKFLTIFTNVDRCVIHSTNQFVDFCKLNLTINLVDRCEIDREKLIIILNIINFDFDSFKK